MKKNIILFTAIASIGYVTLSSYSFGGSGALADGTKATGTTATCARSGCHAASSATTAALELDSAGVAVTSYVPGMTYNIKISGSNTSSLPKFGFQVAVVKAAGAGTSAAANAGTLATTGLPTGVRNSTVGSLRVLEQSIALTTGSSYLMGGLPWTAPASGTGAVVIYGCINAVNGTGGSDGDAYASAPLLNITERIAVTTSVATAHSTIEVKAFPNPVMNSLNIQISNGNSGVYAIAVYDINGRSFANLHETASGNMMNATINTASLAAGRYFVVVESATDRKVIPVVKQ